MTNTAPPVKPLHIAFSGTRLDFVKFQVRHSVPAHLSDGEITLVAYIHLYGDEAATKFMEDGHSRSEKSVGNYMTMLRQKGVVTGKKIVDGLYLSDTPHNHFFTFDVVQDGDV